MCIFGLFAWYFCTFILTHWGRVTHICVNDLTIIGSDNGLSPGRRQAITWTNVGILLIGPLGTTFSEMLIEIHTFSFKKIHLKMSSGKRRLFCLGLNVLNKKDNPPGASSLHLCKRNVSQSLAAWAAYRACNVASSQKVKWMASGMWRGLEKIISAKLIY